MRSNKFLLIPIVQSLTCSTNITMGKINAAGNHFTQLDYLVPITLIAPATGIVQERIFVEMTEKDPSSYHQVNRKILKLLSKTQGTIIINLLKWRRSYHNPEIREQYETKLTRALVVSRSSWQFINLESSICAYSTWPIGESLRTY